MKSFWIEFGQIALAHGLAVASPGPDFALVLRESIARGRRAAVWASVGIGCGIAVHISYSLLGVGLLLSQSIAAFTVLKFVGATYLGWIGVQALRSARPRSVTPAGEAAVPRASARNAWVLGFLTNVLNPKATLFFLALFPTVVSAATPKWVQVGYGLWMAIATILWFSFVAVTLTRERPRRLFLRWSHWIDRLLGIVFLAFAAGLALTSLR